MEHVDLECHCLFHEIDTAIPALFELPGVPVPDSQIHRAVVQIKRMVRVDSELPLHFKAAFSREKGQLIIAQFHSGKLIPMWGVRGLPTMAF